MRFFYDGLTFWVNDNGELTEMISSGPGSEAYIPQALYSGEDMVEIKSIGPSFVSGRFSKITISNAIEVVNDFAFMNAHVGTVVWSKGCKTIPAHCFSASTIERISNIEDVTKIKCNAFDYSYITHFDWPAGCKEIPVCCFSKSALKVISNIDNVTKIGRGAFSGCDIKRFKWPSGCDTIPDECFFFSKLQSISNVEHVTRLGKESFSHCKLKSLDMSNLAISDIGAHSFAGILPDNITLPYYFSKDDCELMFREVK